MIPRQALRQVSSHLGRVGGGREAGRGRTWRGGPTPGARASLQEPAEAGLAAPGQVPPALLPPRLPAPPSLGLKPCGRLVARCERCAARGDATGLRAAGIMRPARAGWPRSACWRCPYCRAAAYFRSVPAAPQPCSHPRFNKASFPFRWPRPGRISNSTLAPNPISGWVVPRTPLASRTGPGSHLPASELWSPSPPLFSPSPVEGLSCH